MGATQTNLYDYILIASLVLGMIIVYFFISAIRQQRANMALRKLNILKEITGLEKERARIASDLHDELGPLLSAVKMKINSFDITDPDDMGELEATNKHIDDIIHRMREISFDLMPAVLLKKGLVRALIEYIKFMEKETKIDFTFIHEVNVPIDEDKSVNMYRITREAVHNAVKHSDAKFITIDVKAREDHVKLRITDDGRGFDYKRKLAEGRGIGLRSIINRAQIANGKVTITSVPGKGTTYMIEIPL